MRLDRPESKVYGGGGDMVGMKYRALRGSKPWHGRPAIPGLGGQECILGLGLRFVKLKSSVGVLQAPFYVCLTESRVRKGGRGGMGNKSTKCLVHISLKMVRNNNKEEGLGEVGIFKVYLNLHSQEGKCW